MNQSENYWEYITRLLRAKTHQQVTQLLEKTKDHAILNGRSTTAIPPSFTKKPTNPCKGGATMTLTDDQIDAAVDAYHNALLVKTGSGIHWSLDREIPAMRAALHALGHMPGDTSDGYHTFAELYDYRMLYNAHAANGWVAAGIPVIKSWRHSDGEECFGGGWFIVTAQLPTGQVSNHYEATHWDLFDVPVVESAPEWDGHTPSDAAERLRTALKKETNA